MKYPPLKCIDLWFRRLDCLLFGHDYEVIQHFTAHSRRVICENCEGDWGMNDDVGAFIKWDKDLEDMYRVMGKTIRPRP